MVSIPPQKLCVFPQKLRALQKHDESAIPTLSTVEQISTATNIPAARLRQWLDPLQCESTSAPTEAELEALCAAYNVPIDYFGDDDRSFNPLVTIFPYSGGSPIRVFGSHSLYGTDIALSHLYWIREENIHFLPDDIRSTDIVLCAPHIGPYLKGALYLVVLDDGAPIIRRYSHPEPSDGPSANHLFVGPSATDSTLHIHIPVVYDTDDYDGPIVSARVIGALRLFPAP